MKTYDLAISFCRKFPMGVYWWRVRKHAAIVEQHLNPGEKVTYAFVGQKNNNFFDFFSTSVIAITNKRILIGRKRILFGYALDSVMPYMFNDLNIRGGIFWGKVCIDTAKEVVVISKVDVNAMDDIETAISQNMMKLKKEYEDGEK